MFAGIIVGTASAAELGFASDFEDLSAMVK
jgi:hypothetical protein